METKNFRNIHLLLVDDNPRYLNELQDWLNEYGYCHIETASNVAQATEKLRDPYDVIIADMRMDRDDSGFTIVEEVKLRNLSSVVIILTANDTVIDCRRAFKLGAWDYICKNMRGDIFYALHHSIEEAIDYFNRWGNLPNEQWINDNIETLEIQYWGKYIAVINQTVIESADGEDELNKLLEQRKLRRFLTTIKKIGNLQPISDLIKLSESDRLEYKSTWQWDVKKDCKNEELKFSVLKTIAAFLNSEGGTVIIGIEDNQNIFGLEKDLSLMSDGSRDKFEQTIFQSVYSNIGSIFTKLIKVRFETIDGKILCAIDVKRSNKIGFLRRFYGEKVN
ncbi:response regulator [Cylindrospermopsis raciborskii]|uniref:Histidine kinase n=1 Tax=Cylindrospermopsis raciborskii CS-505 TaxID=533240 RepID=A0A853MAE1_9CYAN|nr:response regulator [Cylindrospermopsis raciborskii]EFA71093.1 hypothetical protein CRC_00159 [Cylindrospermopsis raciborskii CS-505]OBU75522.1 histidine kinase [Cylindrospermopsis raciborskii CS-505]